MNLSFTHISFSFLCDMYSLNPETMSSDNNCLLYEDYNGKLDIEIKKIILYDS